MKQLESGYTAVCSDTEQWTREQKLEKISRFTLFSDVFMSVVLNDISACQYVLRILTGNKKLKLSEVKTQYTISKLISRGARIDVLAADSGGTLYGIEIQGQDDADHPRRVRFYTAMIDSEVLEKGISYHKLPDLELFYVCREDFQESDMTFWRVEKHQGDTKKIYEDGLHIWYVNAEIDDRTPIAELMKYFLTADPEDMSHGDLSKRVHYLKCEEGGQAAMCEITEEFWKAGEQAGYVRGEQAGYEKGERRGKQESKKQIAKKLSAMGIAVDVIAKAVGESVGLVAKWI